jgi:hypothetical protein
MFAAQGFALLALVGQEQCMTNADCPFVKLCRQVTAAASQCMLQGHLWLESFTALLAQPAGSNPKV